MLKFKRTVVDPKDKKLVVSKLPSLDTLDLRGTGVISITTRKRKQKVIVDYSLYETYKKV